MISTDNKALIYDNLAGNVNVNNRVEDLDANDTNTKQDGQTFRQTDELLNTPYHSTV